VHHRNAGVNHAHLFIEERRSTNPHTGVVRVFKNKNRSFCLVSFILRSAALAECSQLLLVPVASLLALGPWAPQPNGALSLESIYRVSLTVDLCEGNKIISFKKLFHHSQLGPLKKTQNPGALGTYPVCPLVKTALADAAKIDASLKRAYK